MIRKNTWIVLAIFALLVVVAYLWRRSNTEKTEADATATSAAPTQAFLLNLDGKITGVRVEQVGVNTVEVLLDELGNWKLTTPEDVETDSELVQSLVSQLPTLTSVTTLGGQASLADLGLDPPAYNILITLEDGRQATISIGKSTPTGSGYYVLSSDRRIYVVSQFAIDSFLSIVKNPPIKAPTPEPTVETTTAVTPTVTVTP